VYVPSLLSTTSGRIKKFTIEEINEGGSILTSNFSPPAAWS
jgi:hypothetical protein